MVIKGAYVTPMPTDDFALAIKLATKFVNLCRLRDVPEDRIKLVIDYIEDMKALKAEAEGAIQPPAGALPPGAPPMDPTGGGAPPPMPPEMAAAMPPVAA